MGLRTVVSPRVPCPSDRIVHALQFSLQIGPLVSHKPVVLHRGHPLAEGMHLRNESINLGLDRPENPPGL